MKNELGPHEASSYFPPLVGKEFQDLVSDIREHGLLHPIVLHDGKILDGRNRLKACNEANVKPTFVEWTRDGSPFDYVWSVNVRRRHLEQGQKVALRIKFLRASEEWLVERETAREKANEARGDKQRGVSKKEATERGLSRDHRRSSTNEHVRVAKDAGVSPATAARALALKGKAPDLFEQVAIGKMPLAKALKQARAEEAKEEAVQAGKSAAALPTGPFSVLYADPPWRYDFAQSGSREIENQYETMDLDAICALPVQQVTADDAVLFLWTPSPKLAEALRVIEAWDFTYRTTMVWVKDKIGMGYWARQQHELLLIAIRGKMATPAPENRPSSVITAPRGGHSEKPPEFRAVIDRMFPGVPKLELFARGKAPSGWNNWGNEAE